jgi:hypothetical protein
MGAVGLNGDAATAWARLKPMRLRRLSTAPADACADVARRDGPGFYRSTRSAHVLVRRARVPQVRGVKVSAGSGTLSRESCSTRRSSPRRLLLITSPPFAVVQRRRARIRLCIQTQSHLGTSQSPRVESVSVDARRSDGSARILDRSCARRESTKSRCK